VSFVEQEVESSPLRPILLIAGAVLAVVLARWRAIILMLFLLLASWMAFQVFLLARGAFLYVNDGLTKLTEQYQQLPSVHVPPTGSATISPSRPITNCWRDRSLGGDCFKSGGLGRQSRPERLRTPEPPPPRHLRFRNCGPIGNEHPVWPVEEPISSRPGRTDLDQREVYGRCWLNDRSF
jgi:hypothetical protein